MIILALTHTTKRNPGVLISVELIVLGCVLGIAACRPWQDEEIKDRRWWPRWFLYDHVGNHRLSILYGVIRTYFR